MSTFRKECQDLFGTTNLYEILEIPKSAAQISVKKAYYKISLKVHPDRVDSNETQEATKKFQVLGRVYAILSDAEKRKLYDQTGDLDDLDSIEECDFMQYWRSLFKKVSVEDIIAFEQQYVGSTAELEDLKLAYGESKGDMDFILDNVLCCTVDDFDRYVDIIQGWIDEGKVEAYPKFKSLDAKKRKRIMKAQKEAKEAEEMRKKLMLDDSEESLESLILANNKRRAQSSDNFFDALAAKYADKPKRGKKSKKTK